MSGANPTATHDGRRPRPGPAALTVVTLGATSAVLLVLFALSGATVAADGTLVEPFGLLALGTLALTGAGLVGLAVMFRNVRQRSTCGRGGC